MCVDMCIFSCRFGAHVLIVSMIDIKTLVYVNICENSVNMSVYLGDRINMG